MNLTIRHSLYIAFAIAAIIMGYRVGQSVFQGVLSPPVIPLPSPATGSTV